VVCAALLDVALWTLRRDVTTRLPFWRMAMATVAELEARARALGVGRPVAMDSVPGAGSAPGVTIPSFGITIDGDHQDALRHHEPPIIARVREQTTYLDLRGVDPADDAVVAAAVKAVVA
jgi:L-seryl-tRNA(Ser) seleniumtransferase